MKFKIADPDDYTEIERFEYKLSRAYSKVYSDYLVTLVTIDGVIESLKSSEPLLREIAIEILEKEINKYKA